MRNIIVIAIIVAIIVTPVISNVSPGQAVGPNRPSAVFAGRRGGNRAGGRRRPQTTLQDRPQVRIEGVEVLAGNVADVRDDAGMQARNAFAAAFGSSKATAIYLDRTAVVFDHGTRLWEQIARVVRARPASIEAKGWVTPRSQYNAVGVDLVMENPSSYLRFPKMNLEGNHDDTVDVLVVEGKVFESHRMTEVPTTGYCVVCRDRVYRRDLSTIYIDRYNGGMWEAKFPGWSVNNYYTNATRGTCERCGMENVVRFGTQEVESVRVADLRAGYVRPVTRVKIERPERVIPEGALPIPFAYCVKCSTMVERRDVTVTTFSNGTPATVGTCQSCETTVYRAGGPVLPDVVVHIQAPGADEKVAFCGDPHAHVIGRDSADAYDLFWIESLYPGSFVVSCKLCEFVDLDQELQREQDELVGATS